ncbi:hypothetical protein B0H19DRAFT_1066542 [Mycena capillaripes]|nr:hypothetical protein B0H19DRAFT_1086625 [Mycena capillaripes]KAJ6566214.1 hypothetical protein B0H19DRAFT_1066542 [Mycena capillaripes]
MIRLSSQDSFSTLKKPRRPRTPSIFSDGDQHIAQTIGGDLGQHRAAAGLDLPLFMLFANGAISVCWAAALIVFSTGVVAIYWGMSQYGQQHQAITNVIMTGVATLSTAHLRYTVKNSARQYARIALHEGVVLERWKWMQAFAEGSIWPPFKWRTHKWRWFVWVLTFVALAAHSASLVAILQPEPFIKTFSYNDPMLCGIDPADLALNFSVQAQSELDRVAFGIGLQLGSYYDQVGGNTTTSVVGRTYVKDNFGYAIIGTSPGALQEVLGVVITAQCTTFQGNFIDLANITSLATSGFPGLTAVNFTNGTGSFIGSLASDEGQAVITSATTFNLTGDQTAMYAVVNASGAGALMTVDANHSLVGCSWSAIPQLIHVEIRNFTALTLSSEDSSTAPAPVGRAVYSVVQGMAEAIRLGALLDGDFTTWADENLAYRVNTNPSPSAIVQTLIADGLKGTLTAYTAWADSVGQNETLTGVDVCNSHNRTTNKHWRFGNDHYLGCVAIALEFGFGMFALWVVWTSWKRTRMKGFDPLQVVDAFKMGSETSADRGPVMQETRDGWILHQGGNRKCTLAILTGSVVRQTQARRDLLYIHFQRGDYLAAQKCAYKARKIAILSANLYNEALASRNEGVLGRARGLWPHYPSLPQGVTNSGHLWNGRRRDGPRYPEFPSGKVPQG